MIAITGGIASGKSTVANILREFGYPVLDADKLVAEIVLQKETIRELKLVFGDDCYLQDGSYNREFVRNKILQSSELKKKLESVLHPKVIAKSKQIDVEFKQSFGSAFLFYEASLVFEAGRANDFESIILVCAPKLERVARIEKRNGFSHLVAERLIDSQLSDNEKRKMAHFVVENDSDIENLKNKTYLMLQELRAKILTIP